MAEILKEQRNFYVVQTQGSFRNEIGEMTETKVYAHVRTRLGNDMSAAEAVLSELEEKSTATVRFSSSLGVETTLEIRPLLSTETAYGIGTNVPCGECGRLIFLEGPVKVAIRDGERWVELQCNSPSCSAYQRPQWYAELALEIHGNTRV